MINQAVRVFTLVIVAIAFATSLGARTWTDRSGKTHEAEYLGFQNGKVRIKRTSDSKVFDVPLEVFSDVDQAFIKAQNEPAEVGGLPRLHWPRRNIRVVLDAGTVSLAKEGSIWTTKDAKRVGYIAGDGEKEWAVIDGKAGNRYDHVHPFDADHGFFSPSGKHFAYVGRMGNRECLVVDDQEDAKYESIFSDGRYRRSARGEEWTYKAFRDGKVVLVTNGKEIHRTEWIDDRRILLQDGHFLYVERDHSGNQRGGTAVHDGSKDKLYEYIMEESLALGQDGVYGYVAWNDLKAGCFCIVNGRESPPYAQVVTNGPVFSPDGKQVGYSVQQKSGDYTVVVNGHEYPVSGLAHQITWDPSGKHWACSVSVDRDAASSVEVLLDGKRVGSGYSQIRGITFSSEEVHLAFVTRKNGIDRVVLDGNEQSPYYCISALRLSHEGRRLAFIAKRSENGRSFAVVDGKEGKQYDAIRGKTLNFSADGRSLFYVAGDDNDDGFLVIDGEEEKSFGRILPPPRGEMFVGIDSIAYLALYQGSYCLIEYCK